MDYKWDGTNISKDILLVSTRCHFSLPRPRQGQPSPPRPAKRKKNHWKNPRPQGQGKVFIDHWAECVFRGLRCLMFVEISKWRERFLAANGYDESEVLVSNRSTLPGYPQVCGCWGCKLQVRSWRRFEVETRLGGPTGNTHRLHREIHWATTLNYDTCLEILEQNHHETPKRERQQKIGSKAHSFSSRVVFRGGLGFRSWFSRMFCLPEAASGQLRPIWGPTSAHDELPAGWRWNFP